MNAPLSSNSARKRSIAGLAYGVAAYGSWGLFPAYFKSLKGVAPLEILSHRIIWSAVFLALFVLLSRRGGELRAAVSNKKVVRALAVSSVLIASNWLIYVWAVCNNHVLEASLGYFINPLVNVVLGRLVLKERLSPLKKAAVGLAATGVAVLTIGEGVVPWISLALAATFAGYGLIRKTAAVEGMAGLLVETCILFVPACGYLAYLATHGGMAFSHDRPGLALLLLAAGPITAIPLIWFANAARRLSFTALGFCQYLSPTGQFLLAVFAYGETVRDVHLPTFLFIWAGIALFSFDVIRREKARFSLPDGGRPA